MFPQASPMLKQSIEVSSKGELVDLCVGNVHLPMHYEHAFDMSRWIREEAALCKRATGKRRTTRSLGTLHDARKSPPLPYDRGVAIHVKEKKQAWRREDVTAQGHLVLIKIGATTISLHFESALKIAQWIRLRAKEAKNRAGDTRHWSKIGEE